MAVHPNIVALKNSSQTPNQNCAAATADLSFTLIAGNIDTFYSGLCDGAEGGVLSTASYLPEYCCQLFQLFSSGRRDEAFQLSQLLKSISKASAGPLGVAGVKAAMNARGLEGGHVRLPLLDVSREQANAIAATLRSFHIPPFPRPVNFPSKAKRRPICGRLLLCFLRHIGKFCNF